MCRRLGITQIISSADHPQTDGATERAHRTLLQYLRALSLTDPNWLSILPNTQLWFNTSLSTATGRTPMEILMGFTPKTAPLLKGRCSDGYTHVGRLPVQTQKTFDTVRRLLVESKTVMKFQADKHRRHHEFKVGDLVFVKSSAITAASSLNKLSPAYMGPFRITRLFSPVTVALELPAGLRIHNAFHVEKLRPVPINMRNITPVYQLPPLRPGRPSSSL